MGASYLQYCTTLSDPYVIFFHLTSQLREARAQFLRVCSDPTNELVTIQQASDVYLSLLLGLVNDPGGSGDSKIRKLVMFKWTNSICDHVPM